jgi:hypothetical protein
VPGLGAAALLEQVNYLVIHRQAAAR